MARCSRSVSVRSLVCCPMKRKPTISTVAATVPTEPRRYLSFTLDAAPENIPAMLKSLSRDLLAVPGRRLTWIMSIGFRCGLLAKREADGEHEKRCDLIGRQRLQRSIANVQPRKRIGVLDRNLEAVRENLREAGSA